MDSAIVVALIGTEVAGKVYVNTTDKSVTYTNEISATLVGKAVSETNLDDVLATKINGLDSALTWNSIV